MTEFQQQVYNALTTIPIGKVVTYQDLAAMIGRPKAVRAVVTALSKNTRIGVVPCHRVVRSTGEVGQFALGTKKKMFMLQKEGVTINNGIVNLREHRLVLSSA